LRRTKITDEGMKRLARSGSLRLVRIDGSDVTAGGIEELKKLAPSINVP
jgi:hypothetical protein